MTARIRTTDLRGLKDRGEKIAMITAYDFTFARLFDLAGVDVILVGDSLGMVTQGLGDTLGVTLDEMIYHSKLVSRGVARALVVGDLPFMSYQASVEDALRAGGRMMKEAGVSAVKLEGGKNILPAVEALVETGIPVMGHLGLTPQSVHQLGGYKVQGRTRESEEKLKSDAQSLEAAGAFAVVIEGVPLEVAEVVTNCLTIPTIGIGAGNTCSGQVLVMHDLLGLHERDFQLPKFVKKYAELGTDVDRAVKKYISEVKEGSFPSRQYSYGGRSSE